MLLTLCLLQRASIICLDASLSGLAFLLRFEPLLFDFPRHLSYNIRNGEVCPFPEMNGADSHHLHMKIF